MLLKQKWSILDDDLLDHFESLPINKQKAWLWLEPSQEFEKAWKIDCFDPEFYYDFEDIVGRYTTITMRNLDKFIERAEALEYIVVFSEPPDATIAWWEGLRNPPIFSLNSNFEEAQNGLLPFQIEGLNYLAQVPYGGNVIWSTGTGKTALMAALIKQHSDVDLVLVVVKRNNKRDMQIKLDQLGDIKSIIIDGAMRYRNVKGDWVVGKRHKIYEQAEDALTLGAKVVLICNYERFRDDDEYMQAIISDRRVLIMWDEMPSKLANRGTKLYKAILKTLYKSYSHHGTQTRPSYLRQYQFTATPIENTPNDQLSCVRIINPTIWPTIKAWEHDHVAGYNHFSHKPDTFKNLDKMRLKLEHMTHFVDKSDPEIAKYFPEVLEDPQYIDWSREDRKVYEEAQRMVIERAEAAKEGDGEPYNAFQLMGILQMLCDNPEIVNASADNREAFEEELLSVNDDDLENVKVRGSDLALLLLDRLGYRLTSKHCQKLERLRYLLEKHSDKKVLIFSTWGPLGMPLIEAALEEWGITYRSYRGTENQREDAKNEWRASDEWQVLLLSDAGSDSIDLPEASVVIHYNLPLKWSKLSQRQNRAHRINSTHSSVIFYILVMADSIEERIIEIITKKLGYHFALYKDGAIEILEKAGITKDELWYLLTGQQPDDMMM